MYLPVFLSKKQKLDLNMKLLSLLSLILFVTVCNGQFIRERDGYQWADGCDFFGDDLLRLVTADFWECGRVCTKTPSCTHFTYAKDLRNCWLKNKNGGAREARQMNRDAVCGYVDLSPFFTRELEGYFWSNGCDFWGDDFLRESATNLTQCGISCVKIPSCTHFTYNRALNNCWLKRKSGGAGAAQQTERDGVCGYVDGRS